MLSEKEIIQKLYEQVDVFYKAMSRKEYAKAAFTHYICECVALFCEVPEEIKVELFGTRQTEKPVEGLMPEKLVLKANDQLVIHHHTLQEITLQEKREREEAWEKCQKRNQKRK